MTGLNAQNETNVHNIDTTTFHQIYRRGAPVLCVVIYAAFMSHRKSLFGIPLPSILLTLGIIMMMGHHHFATRTYLTAASSEVLLLGLLAVYALINGRRRLLIAIAGATAIIIALWYVNASHVNPASNDETREYLLSLFCLFYSLELLLARKAARTRIAELLARVRRSIRPTWPQRRGARVPVSVHSFLLAACALFILSSIGLVLFQTASVQGRIRHFEALVSREPEARSHFDIYLEDDRLIYAKQPCTHSDIGAHFFLDLTPDRGDDPNFVFRENGVRFDGRCVATVGLPDTTVSEIRTGQFYWDYSCRNDRDPDSPSGLARRGINIWESEVPVSR